MSAILPYVPRNRYDRRGDPWPCVLCYRLALVAWDHHAARVAVPALRAIDRASATLRTLHVVAGETKPRGPCIPVAQVVILTLA